jgi:hypothetical protein
MAISIPHAASIAINAIFYIDPFFPFYNSMIYISLLGNDSITIEDM